MQVRDSLDTCLSEVLEHAASDVCIVRETMRPWKMALSGSFFGQVLLFIEADRPKAKKSHGSQVFVFWARNDGLSQRGKLQCQSTQISPTY